MKTRKSHKLDRSSVAVRLGVCAAAIGGAAAITPEAQAGIVTFSTPIAVPNNIDGVYINLLTGATGTTGASVAGWDFNPYLATNQLNFFWNNVPANTSGGVATASPTGTYLDLPDGTVVGPSSLFATNVAGTTGSPFLNATGTHILGFRFQNENTNTVNYGYLTMSTTSGGGQAGFPATVLGWSFEDTGAPITVVAVPEPSSMLLSSVALAMGARGLRKWRRKGAAV